MQRFSTPRLLVPNGEHSEDTLVGGIVGLGLPVSAAEIATTRTLLGLSIAEALDPATAPDAVVRAWANLMSVMAMRGHSDSVALLVALAAMANVLTRESPRLRVAIEARGWNAKRSASEAAMRLFGTEFNMGRRLVPYGARRDAGRALIVEALATSAHITIQRHSKAAQQRYHGMRGVAYLVLARGEFSPARLPLLDAASSALAASRHLGDRSPQHYEYAVEALLRQNQVASSDALLAEAEALLSAVGIVSRRLAYNAGDLALTRGVRFMADGRYEDALAEYRRAANAYSSGLGLSRRNYDMTDGDLRAKRGYVRLRAYYAVSRLSLETSTGELDGVVADLECGGPDTSSGLSPLPEALLWRAAELRALGHRERAIKDLMRAINLSPTTSEVREVGEVRARARCELAECKLELAIAGEDASRVEDALHELLAVDPASDPSIPLLANGIRRLVADRGKDQAAPLIRGAAVAMRNLMNRPHCKGATRAFAAGYAAGVLLRLGDLIDETELRQACELYTEALVEAANTPGPEILALAADAKMRLAKALLRSGGSSAESFLLLEDAAELLGKSINSATHASEAYEAKVAHSKLGEVLVRLSSLSGDLEHAKAAAMHLERSRDLGNGAPELLGLLGDCYYRVGRATGDVSALRQAASLKAAARSRATEFTEHHVSMRENWSVTARIEEALWIQEGDRASVSAAIGAAIRAHSADPQWPWPAFQLAALRRTFGDAFNTAVSATEVRQESNRGLDAALQAGTAEALETYGAEQAVRDDEFRRRVLGGRTQVYVLDDHHGLLSGTIVLKRNARDNAEREAADAAALAAFLRSSGAGACFAVARPLAVVPLGKSEAVYAMQHVKGRELGALIVSGLRVGRPLSLDLIERVADFLAWFHSWAWREGAGTLLKAPAELRIVATKVGESWATVGCSRGDAEALSVLLAGVLPGRVVHLRKKDAHPENWLVTTSGEVVLIDLESKKLLPALYDFVQLVDDYPIVSVDAEGMRERRRLLDRYQRALADRIPELAGEPLVDGDPWNTICGFLLFRAAFGLARLSRRGNQTDTSATSSALRSVAARRAHYVKLIEWLAVKGSSPAVAACAQHLCTMVRRASASTHPSKTQ